MIRRRCEKDGHRWWPMLAQKPLDRPLPLEFCDRWFCDGAQVSPWVYAVSPSLAAALEVEIEKACLHERPALYQLRASRLQPPGPSSGATAG